MNREDSFKLVVSIKLYNIKMTSTSFSYFSNTDMPEYLMDYFTHMVLCTSLTSEISCQLRYKNTRSAEYQLCLSIYGQKLWNDLRKTIQNCVTVASFKTALFTHNYIIETQILDRIYYFKVFLQFIY